MNWDYIIIGAGSAGCALAYQIARADRNESILVLEAGGSDRSPYIKFPAGQIRAVAQHDWGYRSQPDPSRNGVTESWLRGRTLGGSSSINGTVHVRGAHEDFDRWAKQLGDIHRGGWSADEVMPLFREFETSDHDGPLRGKHGALHVRTVKRPHSTTQAFIESAGACGYPFNPDYNSGDQEGASYVQLTQRKGLRCSSADAFLKPLLGRKNIKLILNAAVQRIEFVKRRAATVSFLNAGKPQRESAQNIIVCAGAIDSPKLLMLSGLGEPQELRRHGIDALVDLPGVGCNLREHPLIKLTYRTRVPTYNPSEGILHQLGLAAEFIRNREGPLSNLFEGIGFVRSSAEQRSPDIQLHFMPLGYVTLPNGGIDIAPYPSVTVLLNKSRPLSSGRIRLASANAADAPLIECRLLEHQADVDTLVRGIDLVRKIMQAEPIASLIEAPVAPEADVQGVAQLQAYVRANTGIAYHPVGTCRMGVGPDAVVGPDLRVHGTENLYVADASIMPDLISGNTNATCMMIGMKLGRQLTAAERHAVAS